MISVLAAFVGGVLALVPALFVSPRRRQLHLIRDEAAVVKEMPKGRAREKLESAHAATVEAYERRVKGLDRVEILRRRLSLMFPASYAVAMLGGAGIVESDRVADFVGVSASAVDKTILLLMVVLLLPLFSTTIRYAAAVRDRRERVDLEVDKLEEAEARVEAARLQREQFEEAVRKATKAQQTAGVRLTAATSEAIRRLAQGESVILPDGRIRSFDVTTGGRKRSGKGEVVNPGPNIRLGGKRPTAKPKDDGPEDPSHGLKAPVG